MKNLLNAGVKWPAIRDAMTGRESLRLSTGDCDNIRPYVYKAPFSADQRYMVFSSDRAGDRLRPYRMDLASGGIACLSDAPDYEYLSLEVAGTGNEALLDDGGAVRAVNLETLESRIVIDHPPEWGKKNMRVWSSADGKMMLLVYPRADGRVCIATAPVGEFEKLEERHVLPAEVTFITHVQFNPSNSNLISYNRHPDRQNEDGAAPEHRARAYLLDLEKGTDLPLLTMPPGWRATHEYWSPDGQRLYFHKKHAHNWVPASIGSIRLDGSDMIEHFVTDTIWLGHSSINPQQTHLVSDSQFAGRNELILIDLTTGRHEVLAWPNASGRPHPYHVHPSFSPDGKHILYNSDASGFAQIYLLPLTSGDLSQPPWRVAGRESPSLEPVAAAR